MIIGIDASKATQNRKTGIEHFVYQLIFHLRKIDSKNQYYLYTNSPLPKELLGENFIEKLTPIRRLWNRIFLPIALIGNKLDVYIQPTDLIPFTAPKNSICVIHDLAYKYFPEAYSSYQKWRQTQGLTNAQKRAKRIISVSQSVKDDLIKYLSIDKNKISVIQLGVDHETFHVFNKPNNHLNIKKYILCTGRIETRKNTLGLIKAFSCLKKEYKISHKLVLAGSPGQNFLEISKAIDNSPYCEDIIMPGYFNHDQLAEIIANADVFVFPSLYEGFGLSVLEAMACGAAIVTSKTSSIPEVVDNAALLCDPEDEKDITEKIYSILSDDKLKTKLSEKAIKRAKEFSWGKTAKEFLDLIEKEKK